MFERPIVERYAFVMVATRNLASARKFWVEQLGFSITEQGPHRWFEIDAGGLRLRMDLQESNEILPTEPDPVIGLKVRSVEIALSSLAARGITEQAELLSGEMGRYAVIHDPDGRAIVLMEAE
jgi:predicted enzyme related to lactoylglutathione lyase